MRLAAALQTMRQHSRPGCLHAELRIMRDVGSENDLCAWRTHLSDGWHARQGSSMFPAQTMKVAAALHTIRPRCLLTDLRLSKTTAQESVVQARRTHLSESWNVRQGCSGFLAQTMRVAAALHTLGHCFRLRCLLARLTAVEAGRQGTVPGGFGGRTCQIVKVQVKRAQ